MTQGLTQRWATLSHLASPDCRAKSSQGQKETPNARGSAASEGSRATSHLISLARGGRDWGLEEALRAAQGALCALCPPGLRQPLGAGAAVCLSPAMA